MKKQTFDASSAYFLSKVGVISSLPAPSNHYPVREDGAVSIGYGMYGYIGVREEETLGESYGTFESERARYGEFNNDKHAYAGTTD